MKILLYIVAGVLITSVIGLSGVGLVTEKGDPEVGKNMWIFDREWEVVVQQKNFNSSKSNTSGAISRNGEDEDGDTTTPVNRSGGDGDEGDSPQGVTIPVPFQDAIDATKKGASADGDEGDNVQGTGDPLKGLNVTRAKK